MTLEEAKKDMLEHARDWSYYIKKMDSYSRDQMVTEQKALRAEGWSVNTPMQYATAADGAAILNPKEMRA